MAPMTLQVFTARIGSRDPDALPIVRWPGGSTLKTETAFAPSEALLAPAIKTRRDAEQKRERATEIEKHGGDALALELRRQADALEAVRWAWYEPRYRAEMRVSYGLSSARWSDFERAAWENGVRPCPDAWRALLCRPRVVLECFCTDPDRCHRRLLAQILAKCGAVDRGEITPAPAVPQAAREEPPDQTAARAELLALAGGLVTLVELNPDLAC